MRNSVSDRSMYASSEEEEEEGVVDDVEEAAGKGELLVGYESEISDSSSNASPRGTRPNSYTTSWPQSYRQSIDIYSSVASPSIGFLGTPTLSKLSGSFITSSFQGRHTPDVISSLIKPLLPTTAPQQPEQQQQERKSSHSLLPPPVPTRRHSSAKKLKGLDHKVAKASYHEGATATAAHGVPIARECTFTQAVLNGINVLCGVGILSTPYAIKEGGWAGLAILLVFAVLSWYTGILLRTCLDSEAGLETYPDIGQAAFGTRGRFLISIVLYLELYACCVEYLILESDNLSSLFPGAHLNLAGIHLNSHVLFAVMATLIVLPTTWLRDLSVLSYISAGGVVASILVVFCLFWVGLVDQVGFHPKGPALNLPTLPIAVGLYGYCYSGHAVFPNIYSSMKKRSQFPSVLFSCFSFCTILFAGAAVLGYLMFGDSTESQFTLNLPHDLVASKIAVWTTVVNPITKFALTLTPLALSLEELIPPNYMKSHLYAVLIRSALTISTLFVALSVPFFGLVMSLIGSFLTMLVTFILPCVCFLSILKGKVTWLQGSLCCLVISVGTVSCAFGTYQSISSIIKSLS